jgi:hypothetical protein
MRSLRRPECTPSKSANLRGLSGLLKLIRSSSMWSQFCNKRKRRQTEPPIDHNDKTTTRVVSADTSSIIAKQSAAAASAFLSASHKNHGIKNKKGCLSPLSGKGSISSLTPCDSGLLDGDIPRTVKSERSALSMLQDVFFRRD